MDRLVRIVLSQRGKENLEDSNRFRYCNNGQGKFTTRWRCFERLCPTTQPEHNHTNKLMKLVAKQTEEAVLEISRLLAHSI